LLVFLDHGFEDNQYRWLMFTIDVTNRTSKPLYPDDPFHRPDRNITEFTGAEFRRALTTIAKDKTCPTDPAPIKIDADDSQGRYRKITESSDTSP
jgi:hypothetical protein